MSVAMVFPGQGSQSVGMMTAFSSLPAVRSTFEEASAALGFDLWKLVQEGPEDQLLLTVNTQPAMLAAGVALFRSWRECGGSQPVAVAGHSLGEYTAWTVAGTLEFSEAVALVRYRGALMQEAVPAGKGGMAALLGLDDDVVRAVCEEASSTGIVEAANYNSPGQVAIAGETQAVQRAVELAKARGAKRAVMIAISIPAHSSLMRPAAERLRERLTTLRLNPPEIPVVNNVDVVAETEPARIREALVRQLSSPVRWVETIQALSQRGAKTLLECGPGGVLAGLVKRAAPELKAVPAKDAATIRQLAAEA
ncbi:MAG: [acyl-carrier-protein] S-malonyltransferase [Proteobacteria bacterium]|nr:MAG: [acyl-carrier-protein] S-malonyltransferase [Pseudomonadota bacterium]